MLYAIKRLYDVDGVSTGHNGSPDDVVPRANIALVSRYDLPAHRRLVITFKYTLSRIWLTIL